MWSSRADEYYYFRTHVFTLFPLPVIEFLQGHRQRVLEGIKMFSRLAKPSAISCVIRRSFSSSTQVWYIFKNEILHDLKYLNTARVKITLLELQWTWSFIYNYKYFFLMQLGVQDLLTLPRHLSSLPGYNWGCVVQSYFFCAIFCGLLTIVLFLLVIFKFYCLFFNLHF